MKDISNFLTESMSDWRKSYYSNETLLHFKNLVALTLYKMELEGQISDGLYENSSPMYHWYWIQKTKCIVDGTEGYQGPEHCKKYTLGSLISHIGKNDGWEWTSRILYYAQFASILKDSDVDELIKQSYYLRSLIEQLGNMVDAGKYTNYDDFVNSCPSYMSKYFAQCSLMNERNANAFINVRSSYDLKELRADAKSMNTTVNTLKHYD